MAKKPGRKRLKNKVGEVPEGLFFQNADGIFLNTGNGLHTKILFKDMLWFEAEASNTNLFTTKETYLIKTKIGQILDKLSLPYLMRVHRSYIINIKYVDAIGKYYASIKDKEIPISRSAWKEFKSHFLFA